MEHTKAFIIRKRQRVQDLAQQGYTKLQIARKLLVGLRFVRKWLHASDVTQDRRGWGRGHKRTHTAEEEARILTIRDELVSQRAIYRGSLAIQQVYEQRYPGQPVLPTRFIERALKVHGLVRPHEKHPRRGGARRRHYPARSLQALGDRIEEIDCIGPRFIRGTGVPFHLFTRRYTKPQPWGRIDRIASPRLAELVPWVVSDWQTRAPRPEVCTMDNALAFAASGHPRALSRFTVFMLNCWITPVLLPPNTPWSHGSVESDNSLFAKKVWEAEEFPSVEALDARLEVLNAATLAYRRIAWEGLPPFAWLPEDFTWDDRWMTSLNTLHAPAVYLVREVTEQHQRLGIDALKVRIPVPAGYLGMFLLVRVDLVRQQLFVFFEHDDGLLQLIHEQPFVTSLPESK